MFIKIPLSKNKDFFLNLYICIMSLTDSLNLSIKSNNSSSGSTFCMTQWQFYE